MGAMQPGHWAVLLLLVVVLFGAKKLPEVARGLGRSARILKSEVSGLHDDEPTKPSPRLETKADSRPADAPRAASTTTESTSSPEA